MRPLKIIGGAQDGMDPAIKRHERIPVETTSPVLSFCVPGPGVILRDAATAAGEKSKTDARARASAE